MKTLRSILFAASALLILAACSKESVIPEVEDPVQEPQEEVVTVPEAVDVLTKAITPEDLKGLSLFIKEGETDGTFYIDVAKDGSSMVKGEIGRVVTEEEGKVLYLDLTIYGALPVKGTVHVLSAAVNYLKAQSTVFSMDLCYLNLMKLNSSFDISVAGMYYLNFEVEKDPETCRNSIVPYLVASDGSGKVDISTLLAMFI